MMNEAIRKRLLMSHEIYGPKRWEGKNLAFKFRYALANYPELLLTSVVAFIIAPALTLYAVYSQPNSRDQAMRKYRPFYTVVRHDDPKVPQLLEEKEFGRHYFPQ